MSNNALYELDPIVDNPLYEGFGLLCDQSLRGNSGITMDFGPQNLLSEGRAWTVAPLAPFWTPQVATGRVRAFNDYPCIGFTIPAFSRRAVDVLRDFLEPNGELLPLVSSVGEYYAYNITTVADILDEERSKIRWYGAKHTFDEIAGIERYECVADKMAGLSIFRLVEQCSRTYVAQPFVDRVHKHGLEGFHFTKLWPLPEGVSWWEEQRKQLKRNKSIRSKGGVKPVKGNSVVLIFPIAEDSPSQAEKDRLANLMDELDALLYDPAAGADAPMYGSLEGDEAVERELRLFLSCPDAEALVEKLRPWLMELDWESPIRMLKRYGEYVDPNCREEWVEL